MGKNTTLNNSQKIILDCITQDDFLTETFYFTGGTALSEVYLHHRESIDLDFFSFEKYDAQNILSRIESWSKGLHFSIDSRYIEPTNIYTLAFNSSDRLKVDFAYYPYQKLDEPQLYQNRLRVDSKLDIATNKLLTTTQRLEVKDFVDLYFLLQEYTIWDLIEGVKVKFNMELEPFILGTDLMVVDDFDYLPKMTKPLTLNKLKSFFHQIAEQISRKSVI